MLNDCLILRICLIYLMYDLIIPEKTRKGNQQRPALSAYNRGSSRTVSCLQPHYWMIMDDISSRMGLSRTFKVYPLVDEQLDPENHQFLMETSLPTQKNCQGRTVNLPEGNCTSFLTSLELCVKQSSRP